MELVCTADTHSSGSKKSSSKERDKSPKHKEKQKEKEKSKHKSKHENGESSTKSDGTGARKESPRKHKKHDADEDPAKKKENQSTNKHNEMNGHNNNNMNSIINTDPRLAKPAAAEYEVPNFVNTEPIENFYTIGREIGRGGFSIVKEVLDKRTGEKRAVKVIDKWKQFENESVAGQRRALDKLWREINIMRQVKHPNILQLFEVFDSRQYIYIVIEFVSGGELFEQIVDSNGLPENRAAPIIKQISHAVQYLHSLNIVHRDVKPENILLTDDDKVQAKLADFGLANVFGVGSMLETTCGSAEYVAPEVLLCRPYDQAVDLWSIGVTTYIVLSGNFPFYGKEERDLFDKILRVDYSFSGSEWDDVSEEAKDFISKLLVLDPKKRLTTEQCLNHPWLKKAPY
jgi:calcium/calmodulin-dependent protein kinase I